MRFTAVLAASSALSLGNAAPVGETTEAVPSIPPQGVPDRGHLAPGTFDVPVQSPLVATAPSLAGSADAPAAAGQQVQAPGALLRRSPLLRPSVKAQFCKSYCRIIPCRAWCPSLALNDAATSPGPRKKPLKVAAFPDPVDEYHRERSKALHREHGH
ncbi:uncharacterized protein MAM_07792 [Metarhizium album ARSEF 1941]|uniref:Uncharacterized protein n=1 Tax=Metarhizium album (strain ARSEF 1941) TaxID=1081103 RepID=A0A0B2WKB9_METAS|nr:uncharacterized protein MAM_07792 [Metarhizium album ARSEF 1941]KHN94363.1 hypothetical protein MAM_07792 [Metarhizium album ARSEF 1941]